MFWFLPGCVILESCLSLPVLKGLTDQAQEVLLTFNMDLRGSFHDHLAKLVLQDGQLLTPMILNMFLGQEIRDWAAEELVEGEVELAILDQSCSGIKTEKNLTY